MTSARTSGRSRSSRPSVSSSTNMSFVMALSRSGRSSVATITSGDGWSRRMVFGCNVRVADMLGSPVGSAGDGRFLAALRERVPHAVDQDDGRRLELLRGESPRGRYEADVVVVGDVPLDEGGEVGGAARDADGVEDLLGHARED